MKHTYKCPYCNSNNTKTPTTLIIDDDYEITDYDV